jgi:hypothetical protein
MNFLQELLSLAEAKADELYKVIKNRRDRDSETVGTIADLISYFGYTLEVGASYQHEKGRKKIDRNPKNIDSLIKNLNNASNNGAANGYSGVDYRKGTVTDKDHAEYKPEAIAESKDTKYGWYVIRNFNGGSAIVSGPYASEKEATAKKSNKPKIAVAYGTKADGGYFKTKALIAAQSGRLKESAKSDDLISPAEVSEGKKLLGIHGRSLAKEEKYTEPFKRKTSHVATKSGGGFKKGDKIFITSTMHHPNYNVEIGDDTYQVPCSYDDLLACGLKPPAPLGEGSLLMPNASAQAKAADTEESDKSYLNVKNHMRKLQNTPPDRLARMRKDLEAKLKRSIDTGKTDFDVSDQVRAIEKLSRKPNEVK